MPDVVRGDPGVLAGVGPVLHSHLLAVAGVEPAGDVTDGVEVRCALHPQVGAAHEAVPDGERGVGRPVGAGRGPDPHHHYVADDGVPVVEVQLDGSPICVIGRTVHGGSASHAHAMLCV